MELGPQFRHFFRILLSQVVLLADILFQIVQMDPTILVAFDQFEVAFPNRSTRYSPLITVVRIMPIQGSLF